MITLETTANVAYDEMKDTMVFHIETDIAVPVRIAKNYDLPGLMLVNEISEDMWGAALAAAAICADKATGAVPENLAEIALRVLKALDLEVADEVDDVALAASEDKALAYDCDCIFCRMTRAT